MISKSFTNHLYFNQRLEFFPQMHSKWNSQNIEIISLLEGSHSFYHFLSFFY